jgi:acetylglutamate kinase
VKKLFVIKIGGNVIDDEKQLSSFLDDFAKIKERKILVHGGGKIATELSGKLGIKSKMIDGRRVTDAETLKVVQMVYGGLINKNIVAQLQARKCNAIGLTGADANAVLATKREAEVDYGFVGDVKKINIEKISSLLHSGLMPVIAPLTHDGKGQMLNTNADTMAAAIAEAIAVRYSVTLVYCFEKSGVLRNVDDENSVIEKINPKGYAQLKREKVISKGMIPKLDNAFDAVKKKVKCVAICHANDLLKVISGKNAGTCLVK